MMSEWGKTEGPRPWVVVGWRYRDLMEDGAGNLHPGTWFVHWGDEQPAISWKRYEIEPLYQPRKKA